MHLTTLLSLCALCACSAAEYAAEADRQVYGILDNVSLHVTGESRPFDVVRPEDTLRERILAGDLQVTLDLQGALDVASENSREFQQQKENLYFVALTLTREQHDFALRWAGGGSADADGVGDEQADIDFEPDLSAAVNTIAGTRIVASFASDFMRSVISGGGFASDSILSLSITQPLLRGLGPAVVREPLTQAERNVVYQLRSFERFRIAESVAIVSEYYQVVEEIRNLVSEQASYESVRKDRIRSEALFDASRLDINQRDQAIQQELDRENRLVTANNRIETAKDRFKLTLGLPVDANVDFDPAELDKLSELGVDPIELDVDAAIELALSRRYDYRTALDEVEDASRRILVSEDALSSALDFSSVIEVPTDANQPLKLDWSRVSWAAGFDLDLALDKLVERNAYRSALISLDAQIRDREELEDRIKSDVRNALRNIQAAFDSYTIQVTATTLAERRVESNQALMEAGRAIQRDVSDAQNALLASQLSLTGELVNFAIARLQLLRDLEGIAIESEGLSFDQSLPIPAGPRLEGRQAETEEAEEARR